MSSKLLKSELKEIVRECLIEILQDGMGNPEKIGRNLSESKSRRKAFDHVSWAKESSEPARPEPARDFKKEVQHMTSDPILAEVLADSHKTMLTQMNAEKQGVSAMAGDFAERKVATSDPVDLFGQAAGNWAALAFDD